MDPIAARKEHEQMARRWHARLRDAKSRRQDAELRLKLAREHEIREQHGYCDWLGVNRLSRIFLEDGP